MCVWMGVSVSIQSPELCVLICAWEGTLTSILWYSCRCLNPLCVSVSECASSMRLACICKHKKEYIWAHEVLYGCGHRTLTFFRLSSDLAVTTTWAPALPGDRPFLFQFPLLARDNHSLSSKHLWKPQKWGPHMAATFPPPTLEVESFISVSEGYEPISTHPKLHKSVKGQTRLS